MKYLALALLLVIQTVPPARVLPPMCVGAQLAVVRASAAALQERSTPKGEWCQRPTPRMSTKAHACSCHQHDCADPDPDHVSAHVDAHCLNYCTVANCKCAVMDCQ